MLWNHNLGGFNLNGNETGVIVYGCTAFNNFRDFLFLRPIEAVKNTILKNNLSDKDQLNSIAEEVDSQCNSWDSSFNITLTKDDFLSFDDGAMSIPRNPDGSIPYNNFLRLAQGSAAIDAGIDVNMPYIGKAPDLGAFEYDPNENAENYVKMFHQYVRDHDIEKINEMLEAGADTNEKDWLGYAPLHWACYFGYADLVTLLIDKGADLNLISDTGRTCLEIATAMDYGEIAELLKKHGAKE